MEAVIFEQSLEGRAEMEEGYWEETHTQDAQQPECVRGPAANWLGGWHTKDGEGNGAGNSGLQWTTEDPEHHAKDRRVHTPGNY